MPDILDILHRVTYQVTGEQNIEKLGRLFQKNGEELGRNIASVQRLNRVLSTTTDVAQQNKLKQAIQNRTNAIRQQSAAIQDTIINNKEFQATMRRELGIIGELNQRLQALRTARDTATNPKALQGYNRQIQQLEAERSGMLGATGRRTGVLSTIGAGITQGLGVAGGFAIANVIGSAVSGIKEIAVDSFKAAANFEQMRVAFGTLTGSQSVGDDLIRQIKEFASITPFGTAALADLSKQLLAYGFNADEIIPTIDMLGNVASGVGKDKMPSLILAFGQIRAAGKLAGQDLLQLINAGFNPLQIISEKTGESMTSLKDKMSKGLITFDMVKGAFKSATSEGGKFFNLLQRQSETTAGKIDALGDSFEQFKTALGKNTTGLVGDLTGALNTLVETVTRWISLSPSEEIEQERIGFNTLVQSLIAVNKEGGNRASIIQELKLQYPELINNINLETASNGQLLAMLQSVNAQYQARIQIAGVAALADKKAQENIRFASSSERGRNQAIAELVKGGFSEKEISEIDLGNITASQQDEIYNRLGRTGSAISRFTEGLDRFQTSTKRLEEGVKEGNQLNKRLNDVKDQFGERNVIIRRIAALQKENEGLAKPGVLDILPGAKDLRSRSLRDNLNEINRLNAELNEIDNPKKATVPTATPTKKKKTKETDPVKLAIQKAEEGSADTALLKHAIAARKVAINEALTELADYKSSEQYLQDSIEDREFKENSTKKFVEEWQQDIDKSELELKLKFIQLKIDEVTKISVDPKSKEKFVKEAKAKIQELSDDALDITTQIQNVRIKSADAGMTVTKPTANGAIVGRGLSDLSAQEKAERDKLLTTQQKRDDARIDAEQATQDAILSITQNALDQKIRMIDYELDYRQNRLSRAQELAERGNVEALQKEQQRIDELTKKREEAGRRQMQINALIQASELAKATAESIGAIVKAASEGDPYTIAFRVAAAVTSIVAGIAAISSAFGSANTGFYDGGYTGDGGKYDVAGPVHKGEFVFDQKKTKQWRPLFEAIHENRIQMPGQLFIPEYNIKPMLHGDYASRKELGNVSKKLDGVIDAIDNISVSANQKMDQYGLMQSVEMVKTKDRRRFS